MEFSSTVVWLLVFAMAAESTKVSVKNLKSGQVYKLNVDQNESVLDFKHQIESQKEAPEALKQVLIFGGRSLENNRTLAYYMLEEGSEVELAGCKHVAPFYGWRRWPVTTTSSVLVADGSKVFVKYLKTAISLPVDINLSGTVRSLKVKIEKLSHELGADSQVLLTSSHRLLDDEQTLEHYNIKDGATIEMAVCVH